MGGSKKPAVPPAFHLRMRLQSSAGRPFAKRDYEIEWGKKTISGTTDDKGMLDVVLDGRIDRGVLDLGEKGADGAFIARLTIPLVRVPPPAPPMPFKRREEPPPAPKPVRLDSPRASPGRPPELLLPPDSGPGSAQTWEEYHESVERRRKWEEEMEIWLWHLELERRRAQTPAGDFSPGPRARHKPAPERPAPPSPESAERITKERFAIWKKNMRLYWIAWRLHNLGHLPLSPKPSFPIQGDPENVSGSIAARDLLDAIRRYAFTAELPDLDEAGVFDRDDKLGPVIDRLTEDHDGEKPKP